MQQAQAYRSLTRGTGGRLITVARSHLQPCNQVESMPSSLSLLISHCRAGSSVLKALQPLSADFRIQQAWVAMDHHTLEGNDPFAIPSFVDKNALALLSPLVSLLGSSRYGSPIRASLCPWLVSLAHGLAHVAPGCCQDADK